MIDDFRVTFNFNIAYHDDGLLMFIYIMLYDIW